MFSILVGFQLSFLRFAEEVFPNKWRNHAHEKIKINSKEVCTECHVMKLHENGRKKYILVVIPKSVIMLIQ